MYQEYVYLDWQSNFLDTGTDGYVMAWIGSHRPLLLHIFVFSLAMLVLTTLQTDTFQAYVNSHPYAIFQPTENLFITNSQTSVNIYDIY